MSDAPDTQNVQTESNGLGVLFSSQRNARILLVGAVALFISCIPLSLKGIEWAVIFLCVGMVLTLETLNTAI